MSPHGRSVGAAFGALLASSTTLVCCVLPVLLVSIGAGATLAGLVAAVPQLVWLSEHKAAVFGTAAALLVTSGLLLWRVRHLPCPTDPALARSCARLRQMGHVLYAVALAFFLLGAAFAFLLPAIAADEQFT